MSHLKNNRGQGLVEYVLLIVLMALLAVGTLKALGTKTHNAFQQAGETLDTQTDYAEQNGESEERIGD